jgi:hypothetical protein
LLNESRDPPGSRLVGLSILDSAMPGDDPIFSIRSLGVAEFVIDVLWPDGAIDQLGRFASPDKAARWIEESSEI